jgi:integrase
MGKRKQEKHRNGDCALGWRTEDGITVAVADYRDENGKRKRARLGVPFGRIDEAKAALDRFAEARRAVQKQQASYLVAELWKLWLKEREADRLSNAIYKANWVALGPFFGPRSPELLAAQDYRDYADARFKLGKAPWTVHTELVRLRACLKWAADTHLIARRPKVWVPRPGKHRDRVLSIDEAKLLVEGANGGDPHVYLFVVLAFATGARHMAILDLTWDRIDFNRGVIEFDEDLPPDPMSKAWRKGRATVPMNKTVRAALTTAHKGRQTVHVIEHGGKRLKSIREGFAAAVARAKLSDKITPHTIRHTVSTWLEAKAVDDRRRAQLLGHANPLTTNKVYTHSSHELLTEAVSLLDAEFAPLPKIAHSEAEAGSDEGLESSKSVPMGQNQDGASNAI